MGLRQKINDNPLMAAIGAGVIVVLAIVVIIWFNMRGSASVPPLMDATPDITKGFYTVDDGKSFFVDSVSKATPFDHGGKQAVRAYVFKCSGKPVILLLGRCTTAGLAMPGAKEFGADVKHLTGMEAGTPLFEIKKPGGGAWSPLGVKNINQWQPMIELTCPDGGIPIPIWPGQQ